MKAIKYFNFKKVVLISLCSFCLIALSFWGCDKENSFIPTLSDDEQVDLKNAHIYNPGEVFNLTGFALYNTWMVKGGTVLQDLDVPCEATLEFLDGLNIKFSFLEINTWKPLVVCNGKMTPSGIIKFEYPTPIAFGMNITDILRMHTCATITGEGINNGTLVFYGKFDGNKFTATAQFMAKIDTPCPEGMFPEPIDGPIHFTFGYDLDVAGD